MFRWEPLTFSHLWQISAAVAGTIALLRITAVADGDPQLATAMLQATGYVAPFIQMALSFVPILVILVAAYVLHYRRIAKRAGRTDLVSVLGSIANSQPWLPEETVTTSDGVVLNGFVLNVSSPWTTVLVDNPRYLAYVRTLTVTSREVCAPRWDKTLIQLLPAPETELAPPGC